ncbi:MAG: hypothetical protein KDA61_20190, partial [Planctomycetales bacterium]|nr:hypothetical protein [Planctomycetales bacterium]
RLAGGRSWLHGVTYDQNQPLAAVFARIIREDGSVAEFEESGTIGFSELPAQPLGMLGAWAKVGDDFAMLTTSGAVAAVAPTSNHLPSASATDHVLDLGSPTLTHDVTVASLAGRSLGELNAEINLGGRLLTVLSGGVSQTHPIRAGRLTAGAGLPAELVVYSTSEISADIVDNSAEGSVGLTVTGSGTALSGSNSYTGATWVIDATLTIAARSAIPLHNRVNIDGGIYDTRALDGDPIQLDELRLLGNGAVHGRDALLDVHAISLESGSLSAPLGGNGNLLKTGGGTAQIPTLSSGSLPDSFTGQIVVQEGELSVGQRFTNSAAQFVAEGGLLTLARGPSTPVVLRGGALAGVLQNATVQVEAPSTLVGLGVTRLDGPLSGSSDLHITGRQSAELRSQHVGLYADSPEYSGDLHVDSGRLVLAATQAAGSGAVWVEEGAQLVIAAGSNGARGLAIHNDIRLRGGSLEAVTPLVSFPSGMPPIHVGGDVYVDELAFVGAERIGGVPNFDASPGLTLDGRVYLGDQATVFGVTPRFATATTRAAESLVE